MCACDSLGLCYVSAILFEGVGLVGRTALLLHLELHEEVVVQQLLRGGTLGRVPAVSARRRGRCVVSA